MSSLRTCSAALAVLLVGCSHADLATTEPPAVVPALQSVIANSYTPVDLGTLGGPISSAWAINDEGTIAGLSTLPDYSLHLFV